MPAQPAWHVRVPEILKALRNPSTPPILDRSAFEALFGVGRRQATRLMEMAGGYLVGKTYIVDRGALIASLEALRGKSVVARERKQRIATVLAQSARDKQAAQVAVPVAMSSTLPAGVVVAAPGRMEIRYNNATELLGMIAEMASAAVEDFAAFEREVGDV